MASAFRTRIRQSLSNTSLRAALDANAERRAHGRMQAFASLPDWRERRQRAKSVRAEVIDNLEHYLEQFITRVQTNGITVHRAQNAAQAVQLALQIIAQQQSPTPKLIAKSKSMVTEEIALNHALENAGHRVVETDLGEYIVQLRNEKPSHIITPAVHLKRQDVGRLFTEKLGIPYTEDIPTLTQAARLALRTVFLDADIGISGVNFGVAETGTLCLVTNEGNGRMVTTLPPIHIAIMGMERLVRNMDDLALMLSLLPRSATGQKLSVYTQLIQKPLPGQQRHLIILDNGRTAIRRSPLREALHCIRCGACLNACPVFREIGGHAYGSVYPGPIGSVISAGFFGAHHSPLAQASTLCGACKDACPVDIDLPKLLLRVRAGLAPGNPPQQAGAGIPAPLKWGLKLYTFATGKPALFRLAQRILGLVTPRKAFFGLPTWSGWGFSKDMPSPARKPFRAALQKNKLPVSFEPLQLSTKPRQPSPVQPAQTETLLEQFTSEVSALNGLVVQTTHAQLTSDVIAFLQKLPIDRVQVSQSIAGLDNASLAAAGIRVQSDADPSIQAGITGTLAAVAQTGTLVICSNLRHTATASLLPEIHLAILHTSKILPDLESALQLPELVKQQAVVLVSGPSRTADIEMTLTIGVHGPKRLVVFMIDERMEA